MTTSSRSACDGYGANREWTTRPFSGSAERCSERCLCRPRHPPLLAHICVSGGRYGVHAPDRLRGSPFSAVRSGPIPPCCNQQRAANECEAIVDIGKQDQEKHAERDEHTCDDPLLRRSGMVWMKRLTEWFAERPDDRKTRRGEESDDAVGPNPRRAPTG